jgi:5-methyltetrahydropteroyltriglutamate--homocysteine methyltransferase
VSVGALFLELCTERAGEIEVLKAPPPSTRVGVGVVNQKHEQVESVDEIVARGCHAIACFGAERLLLTPECGFATFADNPVASSQVAEAKLLAFRRAAEILRRG